MKFQRAFVSQLIVLSVLGLGCEQTSVLPNPDGGQDRQGDVAFDQNIEGGECSPGYEHKPNGFCEDLDECALGTSDCDARVTCTNTPGSFVCGLCPTGYQGDGRNGEGHTACVDVNECLVGNGGCDVLTTCTNSGGARSCGECPSGYSGSGETECIDVDECVSNNGGCDSNTTCTNTLGGRTCGACPSGFIGDGLNGCVDVNECASNNGGCDPRTSCSNIAGGRTCGTCPTGYSGDGVGGCQDINECLSGNGGCTPGQNCSNTAGSFSCSTCPSGFTSDGSGACRDIDECLTDNGGCDPRTTCTNTQGSRTCGSCPSGFAGDGINGCRDINECLTGNGGCDALSTCNNTAGGRTCGTCPSGYSGTGTTGCVDINECQANNGGCDALALCINTAGSRTCGACPSGYSGNGATGCRDINECETNNGGCDVLTTCTNTAGSRTCGSCPSGYSGNGQTGCRDVNECQTNNGGCDVLTTCSNTAGSRTCGNCPNGYSGDGQTACRDINECQTNNGGCDVLTTCSNTAGSRTCGNCPSGYTGNGTTGCVDLNECLTNNGLCDENATCSNTPGDWDCTCNTGYSGDGFDCTLSGCATGLHICGGTCVANNSLNHCGVSCVPCALAANALSMGCDGACYVTGCSNGYRVSSDRLTCEDIDECADGMGGCGAHAECVNTPGSATCRCSEGYIGDGRTCALTDFSRLDYVKAPNTSSDALFGARIVISADGQTMVVSAPNEGRGGAGVNPRSSGVRPNSGAVYVYARNEGSWQVQAYIKAESPIFEGYFGTSVALSANGDRLVVGATGHNRIFSYGRNAGVWTLEETIADQSGSRTSTFGSSVSLSADGNRLATGIPTSRWGLVALYQRTNNAWTYVGARSGEGLTWPNGDTVEIGRNVALLPDGSGLFVGSPDARVFLLSWGALPGVRQMLVGDANFGSVLTVSADGQTLLVGSSARQSFWGMVRVYTLNGTTWTERARLTASNYENYLHFGTSVSVSANGDVIAIGTLEDVYLFRRTSDGTNAGWGGGWSEQGIIRSPHTTSGDHDRFGTRLALSPNGSECVIGATSEDGSGVGLNPVVDELATDSGAIYVAR